MKYADSKCALSITSRRWSTALTSVLLISTLCLLGCSARTHVSPQKKPRPVVDHSITLNFQQSFVNNNACSSTLTTSCISGFNEGFLQGTTPVQLHNDASAICTGMTQPESCASTFNGLLPIGSITFYVDTTFVDQNGVAGVTGHALSSPVLVSADRAQNVNVIVGP